MTDYLPKLVDRIEYTMNQMEQDGKACDRALLLDYKAELLVMKKEYKSALKKRQKAISIMESTPLNSEKAETYLLSAETIITDVMGTNNEYTKSVYKYLYNLYARWHKTELAGEYREKCLT